MESEETAEGQPASRGNAFNRGIVGFMWVLLSIVAFFVSANAIADELGYDLNVELFAYVLVCSLAFIAIAASLIRFIRWTINTV